MRPPRPGQRTAASTLARVPDVPAHVLASVEGAAWVYVAVKDWLRAATSEPSRRQDVDAWETWRDTYYNAICDVAEDYATTHAARGSTASGCLYPILIAVVFVIIILVAMNWTRGHAPAHVLDRRGLRAKPSDR